jgi:hypothetical protein
MDGVMVTLSGELVYQTKTNKLGEYMFDGVRTGKYTLLLTAENFLPKVIRDVDIKGRDGLGEARANELFRFDCSMFATLPGGYTEISTHCDREEGQPGPPLVQGWEPTPIWNREHSIKWTDSAALVSGTVLGPTGASLSNAEISGTRLNNNGLYVVRTTTDPNGTYSFIVRQGDYELTATKPGQISVTERRSAPNSGFVDFSTAMVSSAPETPLAPLVVSASALFTSDDPIFTELTGQSDVSLNGIKATASTDELSHEIRFLGADPDPGLNYLSTPKRAFLLWREGQRLAKFEDPIRRVML